MIKACTACFTETGC